MSLVALASGLIVVVLAARFAPCRTRAGRSGHAPVDPSDELVAVLEDVERDVRTGHGLTEATALALSRHPSTLTSVGAALGRGALLAPALDSADTRGRDERLVVQTLRAARLTGGRAADAGARAIVVLRVRRAWRRERRAHAAQARLSATVMTLVPLVFAAWSAATSERVRAAYSWGPFCAITTAIGLLLNLGGWVWMRAIVRGRLE